MALVFNLLGTVSTFAFQFNMMGAFRQIAEYLYIKKRDPNAPHSRWMQYMHGINRISIFMFLLALLVIAIKFFFFKKH